MEKRREMMWLRRLLWAGKGEGGREGGGRSLLDKGEVGGGMPGTDGGWIWRLGWSFVHSGTLTWTRGVARSEVLDM